MPPPLDLSHVRDALGIGFEAGTAWFSLDEADAKFAPQKSPGHRAVILRRWRQAPIVYVYARSASSAVGLVHQPHTHQRSFPNCWLRRTARIVWGRHLAVKRSCLTEAAYMCAEPDPAVTAAVMSAYCPP